MHTYEGSIMARKASQADVETRRQIEEVLFEAACTIKLRKKDLLKWPDDDEHLHQYRISVRVARSLVKFLKPYQDASQNQRLKANLKALQDPTSRMRELDVLVPLLAGYPELQEQCRQVQLQTRGEFIAQLEQPETAAIHDAVEHDLKHLSWCKAVCEDGIDADKLAERINARKDACEQAITQVDWNNQEAVHDLRKQAKAVRYISRELNPALPCGIEAVSVQMREMQDKLGAWCDARVNAALITEICGAAGAELAAQYQAEAEAMIAEMKSTQTKET